MKNKVLIIITIIFAFVTGGVLTYLFFNNTNDNKASKYNSCSNCMSGTMVVENGGIKETVNKVYDAVVMIKCYKDQSELRFGSGFVYKIDDKYGYILTNQHVIDEGNNFIVTTVSNEEVEAKLLGEDKYLDVAVLRIPKDKAIASVKLGSSDKIELGETIVVIGTSINEDYINTVTGGYVSGINRKVTASVKSLNDWVQDVIQVDAPINHGNSGGPLVNVNGEVIGIVTLKTVSEGVEGVGFAIKINDVIKHISELEKGKISERPYIGITYANTTELSMLAKYNITLSKSMKSGVVVLEVTNGGAAEKAGIIVGDVITKIDGEEVKNMAHLKYFLFKHNVGDKIKVTFIRGTEEMEKELTLTTSIEE